MAKTMVTNISCSQIMIFFPLLDAKAGLILLEISDLGIPQSYMYIVVVLTKNDDQPVDLVNHGVTLEMKPIEMGSSSHHGLCEAGKQRHGSKLGPTTMVESRLILKNRLTKPSVAPWGQNFEHCHEKDASTSPCPEGLEAT